jgi:hypothetical protein
MEIMQLSLVVAFMVIGLVLLTPSNVRGWSADVTLWQDTVTSGTNQTISIAVTDDWVLDYTIEYVNVTIDWPGGPVNRSASGTPCQVWPGDPWAVVYFFDLNVLVPTPPNGTANYHVFVTLTADDHQNSTYSDTYVLIITVVPLEPPGTLEGGTFFFGLPLLICGGLVVALVVVLIVVLVVVLAGRRRQQEIVVVMPQQDMRFKQ